MLIAPIRKKGWSSVGTADLIEKLDAVPTELQSLALPITINMTFRWNLKHFILERCLLEKGYRSSNLFQCFAQFLLSFYFFSAFLPEYGIAPKPARFISPESFPSVILPVIVPSIVCP